MRVNTVELEGAVLDSLQILLRLEGIEERREISIEGWVKVPLTFTPAWLDLNAAGFQDIQIRNNLEKDILIREFILPGDFMEIHWPGDLTLEGGATETLQVRWEVGQIPNEGVSGSIEMRLFEPLYDGRNVFYIPISGEQP